MTYRKFTTVVIGPDGREFDLAVRPFPITNTYIPKNAYVKVISETEIWPPRN